MITVDAVLGRLPRLPSDDQVRLCEAWLPSLVADAEEYLPPGATVSQRRKAGDVVARTMVRFLLNPLGLKSEGEGDYSIERAGVQGAGGGPVLDQTELLEAIGLGGDVGVIRRTYSRPQGVNVDYSYGIGFQTDIY